MFFDDKQQAGQHNALKWFAAILAGLIAVVFYDVLLGLGTFVIRDYSIFAYPLAHYHRETFWNGEIALWNPYNNFGIPHLAQWSTLILYPPSLIYLLFPLPWSLSFFCLVHLWFGGVGMFLLARRWTGSPLAAAIAGIAFSFNGFSLNCLTWPAFLAGMMFMPWVIWLVSESWTGDRKKFVWGALAGATQMMTGAPEVIFLTWVFLGCLWIKELILPGPAGRAPLLGFPFLVLLVAALAAPQLLPFFDLLGQSQRSAEYADSTWSLPPWGFANLLVPLFRFYRAPNGVYFQIGQDWTSSYYLGIGVLLFAILAAIRVRNTKVWILAGLALITLFLSFGEHSFAYPLMRKAVPQLGFMRYPIKFVLFAAFAFPLLAGFGVKWLADTISAAPRKGYLWLFSVAGILVLGAAAVLIYAQNHGAPGEPWPAVLKSGVVRIVFVLLIAGAFYGLGAGSEQARKAVPFALLILFFADPVLHAPSQNPRVPMASYRVGISAEKMKPAPRLGEARAMMTRQTHDTLYGSMLANPESDYLGRRLGLFGNSSLIDRIPNADGFYSLYLRRPREAWAALFFNADTNATVGLADFLGVSLVSHPTEFLSWAPRPTALPMVTAGQRPVFLPENEILPVLSSTNFNPREIACFEEDLRGKLTATNSASATISNLNVSAHEVTAEVEISSPGIVVLSQSHHPNWNAFVDGASVELLRVNHGFQAVQVPEGKHTLRLVYRDERFQIGLGLAVGALLILGAIYRQARGKSVTPVTHTAPF